MTAKPMQIHPLAELVPEMTASQFSALKEDIREHGQRDAITLLDGMILDGRNRERACREIGKEPFYEDFRGDDPEAFVISKNLKRRHLTPDQQKTLADVRRKKVAQMRSEGMSTRRIAEELDVSKKTVQDDLEKQGGYPYPPDPKIEFTCKCGEVFDKKVWHCDECNHHWPVHVEECRNCHKTEKPEQKVTGKDGKQYPSTKPKRSHKKGAVDPMVIESVRKKIIAQIQQARNLCEKHGWDDTSELLKRAQNSLKG